MKDKPYACSLSGKYLPEVKNALKVAGPNPAAVAIDGLFFYYELHEDRILAHERKHLEQQAGLAPFWLFFLPMSWRAYVGALKFARQYLQEHDAHGYVGNIFEIEARLAESQK